MKHCTSIVAALALTATFAACAQQGAEPEWNSSTEEATVSLVELTTAVAAMAGPSTNVGIEHGEDDGDVPKDDDATGAVSDNVVMSWVVDPACVTATVAGFSLTAVFDGCVLSATGEALDGAATIGVALFPTRLWIDFAELSVADDALDGNVTATFRPVGDKQVDVVLDIDMAYTGSAASVSLQEVAIHADPLSAAVSLDGAGHVTTSSATLTSQLDAVTWQAGDCHPSSGSAVLNQGAGPITVSFLPTTPTDGIVSVQLGSLPAFEQALLAPCE